MQYFLLVGAAVNFLGAIKLVLELARQPINQPEYLQLKLFVVGVAATFGVMYVYLFFFAQYIFPCKANMPLAAMV